MRRPAQNDQNEIIHSRWLKPWGTCGLKAADCRRGFHATYSYLFTLNSLILPR